MGKYLIGCDLGTSAAKAVLMDTEGKILGSHYVEYPTYKPREGYLEHDPNDYWRVFCENMHVVLDASGVDPREIAGIGVSSCGPNCVMVDRSGKALGRCQIWMDRRGVVECDAVRQLYSDKQIFEISANPLDPHYAVIKLLWEKNHRPDLYRKTYKILSSGNYINLCLTGNAVMDYSSASITGVAYDVVNRRWRTDVLERIGLDPEKFPETVPCHQVIGTVTKEAAAICGLAEGTPVVAGTVDSNAGWLSNGCVHPGDASFVMGTAGCMCVVHDTPVFTENMMNSIHVAHSDRYYTTLAGTACCGGLLHYLRDCFAGDEAAMLASKGQDIYERFSEEAAAIAPGAEGLIILPYFAGERTPLWSPIARGMAFGISLNHTRAHWIRALMESGIYAVYHCLELMRESGLDLKSPMPISEGGANSPVWRQIAADILGVEISYMKDAKGAPVGNAINAGVGVGVFKDWDVSKEFVHSTCTHAPDPKAHDIYMEYYQLYRRLYEDNKEKYETLQSLKTSHA